MKSSEVKEILKGKTFESATEIVDELVYFVKKRSNVAFSLEEIVLHTTALDLDDVVIDRSESNRCDIYIEDSFGDEIRYTIETTCYYASGNDGCGDDELCYTFRVKSEKEDVFTEGMLSGGFSVNSLKDMRDWMDEWLVMHKDETAWPHEVLELVCERNGWEICEENPYDILTDGVKRLTLNDDLTRVEIADK